MKLTFSEARIQHDNGAWLCLKVNEPAPACKFVVERKDRLYDVEIKVHRKKRSLDANALYWLYVGKLARSRNETADSIYRRHIRDIANYTTLCTLTDAVPAFEKLWKSGHLGRFIETKESKISGYTTVLAYYGSSDFDTREMSRLIDNCLQDCREVGIDTTPLDKLDLLKG